MSMPVYIIDTSVADGIQVFDDGTTLADIMRDIGWAERERVRGRTRPSRATGAKRGRPAKKSPVEKVEEKTE